MSLPKPYYERGGIALYVGDCRDILPGLEGVTAVVCDPPYGLGFMGKEWDTPGAFVERKSRKRAGSFESNQGNHNPCDAADRARTRQVEGVKMQAWHQAWAEALLPACLPGAPLLAFGGTRTSHRLTCAIEDAGWEVRDCLMWLYGSGFPKSANISKMLDKAAGAEREVVSVDERFRNQTVAIGGKAAYGGVTENRREITAPATDAARLWDGWGTGLKPAYEPITLAMKPLDGTFAANALKHGVAGLAIDKGRVGTSGASPSIERRKATAKTGVMQSRDLHSTLLARTGESGFNRDVSQYIAPRPGEQLGRWPANLLLSHVPDTPCPACVGDYPACRLCGGSGVIEGCKKVGVKRVKGDGHYPASRGKGGLGTSGHGGQDELAESYMTDETVEDFHCVESCPVRCFPETKSGDLTGQPRGENKIYGSAGATIGTPRYYKGDSGSAARFFHTFPPEASRVFYTAKASGADRGNLPAEHLPLFGESIPEFRNFHPTCKPTNLMEYLVKLVSMPERNLILDPFAGSGTTLVACKRLGLPCIGIELNEEYAAIAARRLAQQVIQFED